MSDKPNKETSPAKDGKGFVLPKQEIATAKRDYKRYQAYIKSFKNPDPILNTTKEGREKGIALFADMKRDGKISSCLRRLRLTVCRNPFAIIPGDDSQQGLDAAEFLRQEIDKHYYNLISYTLDALGIGFSVSEFWCEVTDMARIAALHKRRQERFSFGEAGELLLKTESSPNGEAIPQEGFIVATYEEEDNNKFGDGILSTCFWPWWFKKNGFLFWANYLERYNQPIPIGTYPSGTKKEKQDDFLEALQSIQSDFSIMIPEGFKVELAKAMDAGAADSYENFIAFLDRYISEAILGSAMNEGQQKYGSRAASETSKAVADEMIEAAAEFAAKVINDTLVPRLISWNFDLDVYPKFTILYKNKKLTKEEAEIIRQLSNAGVAIPAADIYDAQGWAIPEADDLVLYKGKLIAYKEVAKENAAIAGGNIPDPATFAEPAPPAAINPLDEAVIADNAMVDEVFAATAGDLRAAHDEKQLIDLVDRAKDFRGASANLKKYKPKNLEAAWREILELGRWLGEYSVDRQTKGGQFAEPEINVEEAFKASFKNMTPKEAIAWLKSKIPVTKAVYDKLEGAAKNAAFYVSGLDDLDLINAMREKMIQAMEKGITFEQFKNDLKTSTGADPFFSNMKTAFYTNIHQAMAAQDYEALERVKTLVPYRRYSAVLDSHTRPEHARWHGFVAPANDEIWDYLYSLLMDFNCRCRITGTTEGEYDAESSAAIRGGGLWPTFDVNPTQANTDKLKEMLKVRNEYADFLNNKVGSWDKIMEKAHGKL